MVKQEQCPCADCDTRKTYAKLFDFNFYDGIDCPYYCMKYDMWKANSLIEELEALDKAMSDNQCYCCSHEFVEVADSFGSRILADTIRVLKSITLQYKTLKLVGEKNEHD